MIKDERYTADNLDYIIQQLKKVDLTKPQRVRVTPWVEKRGDSANAQQHVWYSQIAKHYGDRTALEVKNFCKDAIGLPLLLESVKHGDKLEFLLCKLDYYRHSHESRMKLIQCLEVTSLFSTPESKQYMEHMLYYYNDLGVMIKFKDN